MTLNIEARPVAATTTCFALIITGAYDDLHDLAKLIASEASPGHLHISLIEYPVGWRLQVLSYGIYQEYTRDLVEQRIREGVAVEIVSRDPMPTYLYKASVPDEMEDYPF